MSKGWGQGRETGEQMGVIGEQRTGGGGGGDLSLLSLSSPSFSYLLTPPPLLTATLVIPTLLLICLLLIRFYRLPSFSRLLLLASSSFNALSVCSQRGPRQAEREREREREREPVCLFLRHGFDVLWVGSVHQSQLCVKCMRGKLSTRWWWWRRLAVQLSLGAFQGRGRRRRFSPGTAAAAAEAGRGRTSPWRRRPGHSGPWVGPSRTDSDPASEPLPGSSESTATSCCLCWLGLSAARAMARQLRPGPGPCAGPSRGPVAAGAESRAPHNPASETRTAGSVSINASYLVSRIRVISHHS